MLDDNDHMYLLHDHMPLFLTVLYILIILILVPYHMYIDYNPSIYNNKVQLIMTICIY